MATAVPALGRSDLGQNARLQPDTGGISSNITEVETTLREEFRSWLKSYKVSDDEELIVAERCCGCSGAGGFYFRILEVVCRGGMNLRESFCKISKRSGFVSLVIDLDHLKQAENVLHWVLHYPDETISALDNELRECVQNDVLPVCGLQNPPFTGIKLSFRNHPKPKPLRHLDPSDIECLINVTGICLRLSSVIPEMQVAVFKCTGRASRNFQYVTCGHEISTPVVGGQVEEPVFCSLCQGRRTFVLCHEKCVFTSKQLCKLQELPDQIPEGEPPHMLFVFLYDNLVDACRPGDIVSTIGIYRPLSIRKTARVRSIKKLFRVGVDAISLITEGTNVFDVSEKRIYPPSFLCEAHAIASSPQCYQILVDSFAPEIWEMDDVKKGLLCQLFGAVAVAVGDGGGRNTSRAEIHILLCGDPATAKSQLLRYVNKLATRSVYVVGRGTTSAGLTASVTRDPETKEFVMESGAVVLSDRGVCCIDEFDKMDENTRAILHEVMEQQTVSFAKAGIVCSLNARTAILASANPIESRYDIRKSVVENINMPANLLSRFDLIYLCLDQKNPTSDKRLAEHICNMFAGQGLPKNSKRISEDFFARYVSYARSTCHPQLSPEAESEIVAKYISLRGKNSGGPATGTPRQLDSLIRLSKALARMELKSTVQANHVEEAARLIRAATYQALTDPYTGRIDFDQLHAGVSEAARVRQNLLGDTILSVLSESDTLLGLERVEIGEKVDEMLEKEGKAKLGRRELDKVIEHFEQIGTLGRVGGNRVTAIGI